MIFSFYDSIFIAGRARAILRGFSHQASHIFCENIRGRQAASNCITALAMSLVKNPIMWTRKTLDEILAIGVHVHRESLISTNKTTTLKPKDIVRIFHIGVNVLATDVGEATITGNFDNQFLNYVFASRFCKQSKINTKNIVITCTYIRAAVTQSAKGTGCRLERLFTPSDWGSIYGCGPLTFEVKLFCARTGG